MRLLKSYFPVSNGNSFDIHYMTVALLCRGSTCNDKGAHRAGKREWAEKEIKRIRDDKSNIQCPNVNTNVIMEV